MWLYKITCDYDVTHTHVDRNITFLLKSRDKPKVTGHWNFICVLLSYRNIVAVVISYEEEPLFFWSLDTTFLGQRPHV